MTETFLNSSCHSSWDPNTPPFYRDVMETLDNAGVSYLVGGAYALSCHTGVQRQTKDVDLFIRRSDYGRLEKVLRDAGYEVELSFPHWLAKVRAGELFIDIIFSSGNGIAEVDDEWFQHAGTADVMGVPVRISPVEEAIWSKAFIMERERYDGADIAHMFVACASRIDWQRLLRRFGEHWRVLLSHLVLFGFIYPAQRDVIPAWVMADLLRRLHDETQIAPSEPKLCRGTLLSREQYLSDTEQQGYQDGRQIPFGTMTPDEVARWTEAIPERGKSA